MSNSFPPLTLAVDTAAIVDECEIAEMLPNCDPNLPIVELAALLYLGDYIHARHCWRRHRDAITEPTAKAALEEWWVLGRALMEYDVPKVWAQLNRLQQQAAPFGQYAQEIGAAVCRSLIPKLATVWQQQPQDALLLGLPRQDWTAFLDQHLKTLTAAAKQGNGGNATEIISFLEGPFLTV